MSHASAASPAAQSSTSTAQTSIARSRHPPMPVRLTGACSLFSLTSPYAFSRTSELVECLRRSSYDF
ncbi:hypothetical protein K523DRAFT_325258 [Schizophyllum commune Tattone D]|nr:hypothetical protein K523DRAFT_325258 [Schizophyllum commune Tattone D]